LIVNSLLPGSFGCPAFSFLLVLAQDREVHMPLTRAVAVSLALVALAAPVTRAQQSTDPVGDPQRGKIVFRSVGGCVNCHGWAADGRTGVALQAPAGSNLRETTLDRESLIETIRCGRPGTAMPYHDRAAYRDDRCYGMVMSDFAAGDAPVRGKTFREKDIVNVVAYLQTEVIGLGKPTFEECTDFFDNPAARACKPLK
jgi:mono/diheme cytochrome c family protein